MTVVVIKPTPEQEDWIKEVGALRDRRFRASKIALHYGPGPHPSGSPQSDHGRRSGAVLSSPLPASEYRFVEPAEHGGVYFRPRVPVPDDARQALVAMREVQAHRRRLMDNPPMIRRPTLEPISDEAYAAHQHAKVLWEGEVEASWWMMTRLAARSLPAVRESGARLAEEIDRALAASTEVDEGRRVIASLYSLEALAEQHPELKALMDKRNDTHAKHRYVVSQYEELRKLERTIDRGSVNGEKKEYTVYLIPETLVEQKLDRKSKQLIAELEARITSGEARGTHPDMIRGWRESLERRKSDLGWYVKDRGDFIQALPSFTSVRVPADPSGDFMPDHSAVAELRAQAAQRGQVVLTNYDYSEMVHRAINTTANSANRYQTQVTDLMEQAKVLALRVKPTTTNIIRDVVGKHVSLGGSIVTTSPRSKGARIANEQSQFVPSSWIEASNSAGPLRIELRDARAHYQHEDVPGLLAGKWKAAEYPHGGAKIQMVSSYSADDFLHEYAHRIEHVRADVLALENAFYAERVGGGSEIRLSAINRAYRPGEVAVPDDFVDPYMGKKYGDDPKDKGWHWTRYGHYATDEAYELLSMGLPRVYHIGPKEIDPDMRNFILGLLVEAA